MLWAHENRDRLGISDVIVVGGSSGGALLAFSTAILAKVSTAQMINLLYGKMRKALVVIFSQYSL